MHRYRKLHSPPFVVAIPKNISKPILPYWLDYPPLLRPGAAGGFPRTDPDERKCLTVCSGGRVGRGWREYSSSGSPPPPPPPLALTGGEVSVSISLVPTAGVKGCAARTRIPSAILLCHLGTC